VEGVDEWKNVAWGACKKKKGFGWLCVNEEPISNVPKYCWYSYHTSGCSDCSNSRSTNAEGFTCKLSRYREHFFPFFTSPHLLSHFNSSFWLFVYLFIYFVHSCFLLFIPFFPSSFPSFFVIYYFTYHSYNICCAQF
jgi:hypothetical protein